MTGHTAPDRPRLLFVSPQFLYPMDAGGKIRTANILKRIKGGAFFIDLIMPATAEENSRWGPEIEALCDAYHPFAPAAGGALRRARRLAALLSPLPVSVTSEARGAARAAFRAGLARKPGFILVDYVHAMALAMEGGRMIDLPAPNAFFAHNVETEIFRRQAQLAKGAMGLVWRREAMAMERFERTACAHVDGVIAVSQRDAAAFASDFGARRTFAIPTGVDLDFFSWREPADDDPPTVVFTGSLDWRANQDGLLWFLHEVWPPIAAASPEAEFRVVGKNPPAHLIEAARGVRWTFTGFVDDIRDHARGAVYVIPLRAGGGTRIKAFEAMAMGVPVVSTGLGVEGLEVEDGVHFRRADDPAAFAAGVTALLRDHEARRALSRAARGLVEENFSQERAAAAFEAHCLALMGSAR